MTRKGDQHMALFLLGLVAFNPPVLRLFGVPAIVFGLPLVYLYLFAAWAILILLIALSVERGSRNDGRR